MKNLFDKQCENLVTAYMKTIYKCLEPPMVLYIGIYNTALDQLLDANGHESVCILTAHNPVSEIQEINVNRALQEKMIIDLEKSGFSYLPGVNCDPKKKFPDEITCWVLGMTEEEGKQLARKYNQNAFVFCCLGNNPALIWAK